MLGTFPEPDCPDSHEYGNNDCDYAKPFVVLVIDYADPKSSDKQSADTEAKSAHMARRDFVGANGGDVGQRERLTLRHEASFGYDNSALIKEHVIISGNARSNPWWCLWHEWR